ncbi:MAG TPA: hypothetical protein VLS44_03755, partial [Nitrospira sp.]|nr:hypothetical protein [Nitrospira sp.]
HPGTREVAQVVQVEDLPSRGAQADRAHVVRSVLEAAGIKLVMLRSQQAHSVPVLASLLGLDPEES